MRQQQRVETGAMMRAVAQEHLDDLDLFLLDQPEAVRQAADDAERYFRTMRTLKKIRLDSNVRQRDVADYMQTTQSAVSELENLRTDPHISTLMRYARAVGARIHLVAAPERFVSVDATPWRRSLAQQRTPKIRGRHLSVINSDTTNWGATG